MISYILLKVSIHNWENNLIHKNEFQSEQIIWVLLSDVKEWNMISIRNNSRSIIILVIVIVKRGKLE